MTDRSLVNPGWWTITDPGERSSKALDVCRKLEERYGGEQRKEEAKRNRLYEGDDRGDETDRPKSEYNVIQSTVDAFTSQLVRQRVRLQFLTSGGNADERERAQGMGRVCEALFAEAGLYDGEGIQVARAGCNHGTSAVKMIVDYEHERILLERFSAAELLVDPRDALYGKPRQLCHRQRIPREVLAARYPKLREEIEEADAAPAEVDEPIFGESVTVAEQVQVFEIWHLPSGKVDTSKDNEWGIADSDGDDKPTHDGRHLILIASRENLGATILLDEPWPIDRFPVAVFRPKPKLTGFWGSGFAERLKRVQLRINKMLARVDGIMDLHARLCLVLNRDAKVSQAILSNDWSRVIECDGPPQNAFAHIVPQTVGAEYLVRIDKLIQWAHDVVGISELSLMGRKPPGIESGTALRTVLDSESVRHSDLYRQYEAFHVDLGSIVVEGLRLLARHVKGYEVIWAGDKELERIRWDEVDLENEKWRLRVWPINLFPQTPTAKMEKLVELFQAQAIDRGQLAQALADEYPDVQAIMGDKASPLRNIERKLKLVIKSGEVTGESAPHEFMDLALAKQIGLGRLNALEADGASQKQIGAVRQWLGMVVTEMTSAANGNAGEPGAPGAPPGGELPAGPPPTPLATAAPLPAKERAYV